MPSRLILLRAAFVAAVFPCLAGCSTFAQVSGSGVVGGQRGETVVGGGVAGHVGFGGRIHPSGDPLADESVLMPVGIDAMLRVNVTNRFTSLAYGGGYYLTADVGPHTASRIASRCSARPRPWRASNTRTSSRSSISGGTTTGRISFSSSCAARRSNAA